MQTCDLGLIGLAVMGQNLVLNMERNGYKVAVYNRSAERTDLFMQTTAKGKQIVPAYTMQDFVAKLKTPRCIMLMVQAGKPVDNVLEQLLPLLDKGDTVLDGGNSFFPDTIRRSKALEEKGIHFLGTGVSGGEEGALKGPSIMPGGSKEAWARAGEMLCKISAKVEGEDCCAYLGTDGAGHYVKMTHNGIEYGDMELICESYAILRNVLGLSADECADVFDEWNKGELDSYLIEITKNILRRKDPDTGKPMVDVILDAAGQKGTGKWTSQQALDLGISAPTIAEAVFARCISAIKEERLHASTILSGPAYTFTGDKKQAIEDVRKALYASKICSYAQGFALLRGAAQEYGWTLDYGRIALMWRGGCIIRAHFLHRIKDAYDQNPNLANLLLDPFFHDVITQSQDAWRKVVCLCVEAGISAPSFTSALSYYDAYRTACLPADLLQAQRDYFGAHTYKRKDKEGVYHTQWLDDEETV